MQRIPLANHTLAAYKKGSLNTLSTHFLFCGSKLFELFRKMVLD